MVSRKKYAKVLNFIIIIFAAWLLICLPPIGAKTPEEPITGCDGDGPGKREPDKPFPTGKINLNRVAQLLCASPHVYPVISGARPSVLTSFKLKFLCGTTTRPTVFLRPLWCLICLFLKSNLYDVISGEKHRFLSVALFENSPCSLGSERNLFCSALHLESAQKNVR